MPDLVSTTPSSAAAKNTIAKDFDLIPTKLLLLLLHGLDAVSKISASIPDQQQDQQPQHQSSRLLLPDAAYTILAALESCFAILLGPRRSPSSFVAIVSAVGARFEDCINNLVLLTQRLKSEIKVKDIKNRMERERGMEKIPTLLLITLDVISLSTSRIQSLQNHH